MKMTLALILTLVSLATPLAAAEDKKLMSDARLEKIQKQLELSDDQISEMKNIKDNGGTRKEIRAVLTKEQRMQLKEAKAKRDQDNQTTEEEH